MKSTTELSVAAQIKCAIALQLAKDGHTLHDLEMALSSKDTEKTAALMKEAAGALDLLKALWGVGSGAATFGAGTALAAGALGAAGLYGGYQGLRDSDKKVSDANAVRQRIDLARRELESQQQ